MKIITTARTRLAALGIAGTLGLSGCAHYDPWLMQDVLMIAETAVWIAAEDARRDAYRAERDYYYHRDRDHRPHHGPKHDKPLSKAPAAPAA